MSEQNLKPTPTEEKKAKKKMTFVAKMSILLGVLAVIFVILLIMAIAGNAIGNFLLLGSGAVEMAVAVILLKVRGSRERKICPECGTRREHHREWIRTTEQRNNTQSSYTIKYTHEYLDTYTCPECGEEMEERVKKDGGSFMEYKDGKVYDQRKAPEEF